MKRNIFPEPDTIATDIPVDFSIQNCGPFHAAILLENRDDSRPEKVNDLSSVVYLLQSLYSQSIRSEINVFINWYQPIPIFDDILPTITTAAGKMTQRKEHNNNWLCHFFPKYVNVIYRLIVSNGH